jgi:hypothetical protein
MIPTPTTMDHIERQNTNLTPSTGKLNYETNKSVSLDRWVRMWPTPDATPRGPAKKWTGTRPSGAKESLTLQTAAKMWPTPTVQDSANNGGPSQFRRNSLPLNAQVKLDQKTTGALNPQWVAWLMGYPTEYLSCVPWETQSSRRSRKKLDKQ